MTDPAPVGRWRWIAPLVVAAAVWLLPHGGFGPASWGLLCLFGATVAALITRPLPAGAVVVLSLTAAVLLRLMTLAEALSGFSNSTVWLIVSAFLFARGFVQTRLGERIAYGIVARLGGRPLRLGYAIALADLVMAPITPSNTARAGGILFPVTLNMARVLGSEPGSAARPLGAFLLMTLYQSDLVVCAMFLTAVAPNPLVAELARAASGVDVTWTAWAMAAAVPGAISLLVVPAAIYRLCPPRVDDTRGAQALALDRLRAMGPMTGAERRMVAVFGLLLTLWLTGEWHGVSATVVAYLGVSLLLVLRVLAWRDVLEETGAWDALVWFGGLVALAAALQDAGFPDALARGVALHVGDWTWTSALIVLLLVYYYAHYAFASLAAHVTAMFPAFFAAAIGLGAPPLLTAISFGVFSSLNAATTHYGTGPAPIIFGAGYLTQAAWWRIGFVISIVHVAIWLSAGLAWWRVVGLW